MFCRSLAASSRDCNLTTAPRSVLSGAMPVCPAEGAPIRRGRRRRTKHPSNAALHMCAIFEADGHCPDLDCPYSHGLEELEACRTQRSRYAYCVTSFLAGCTEDAYLGTARHEVWITCQKSYACRELCCCAMIMPCMLPRILPRLCYVCSCS